MNLPKDYQSKMQEMHGSAIHLQEQALSSMLRKIIRKANLL